MKRDVAVHFASQPLFLLHFTGAVVQGKRESLWPLYASVLCASYFEVAGRFALLTLQNLLSSPPHVTFRGNFEFV